MSIKDDLKASRILNRMCDLLQERWASDAQQAREYLPRADPRKTTESERIADKGGMA